MQMRLLGLALFSAMVFGCAGRNIVRDGKTVSREEFLEADAAVRRRAAFDLDCEEVRVTLLETKSGNRSRWHQVPTQMGVAGCGQRAVYVHVRGTGWVLNSESRPARD